jgi:hypothetical protein
MAAKVAITIHTPLVTIATGCGGASVTIDGLLTDALTVHIGSLARPVMLGWSLGHERYRGCEGEVNGV